MIVICGTFDHHQKNITLWQLDGKIQPSFCQQLYCLLCFERIDNVYLLGINKTEVLKSKTISWWAIYDVAKAEEWKQQ